MKALTWHGQGDVRVDTHPDPEIEEPTDAIIRVTSTAICGSDLHLFDGFVPMMKSGDIIGHEPMGIVEEVGSSVTKLKKGDRVVVPFTISCGSCWFCDQTLYSLCDNTNPKPENARQAMGHAPAGIYGYSHLTGGIPGGQAEYLRVPHADVGPIKVPDGLTDEQVLFLSDIFPTGYMGAENAEIEPGDTVAVWGCGPVGQFAIQSAWMLGAGRVIAIDREPERLRMAAENSKAEIINFEEIDGKLHELLADLTDGRGPDRCIEAVGMEAHGASIAQTAVNEVRQATHTQSDRTYALNEAIMACRKGGTISMPGVYAQAGTVKLGPLMNKGLTLKTGQTHVQRYLEPLMGKIESGEIDPSFIITHEAPLDKAPMMYETFRDKKDDCIKVVLKP